MAAPPVDYYATLEVDSKASQQQIREAYKRQALRHHPDRVAATSPDRAERTRKFQQINDAYYTLSDETRRREYDASRRSFEGFGGADFGRGGASAEGSGGGANDIPGGFPWSTFTNFGRSADAAEPSADAQFQSVFEEMMRDEGMAEGAEAAPTGRFWSIVGALSGGAMGFIVANLAGAVAGGVAGNRLGALRDQRGKSVYAVYQELEQPERMRLLSELASKVFAHAIS